MPIPVIAAAVAIAASVPLLWWALAGARVPKATISLNLAGSQGLTDLREAVLRRSAGDRAVRPAMDALADRARRLTPRGFAEALERRIVLAGRPPAWPLERVLGGKLLLAGAGALLGFFVFSAAPSTGRLLLWVAMGALGYFAPDLLLWSRGQERQKQLQLELPDTLDQLTIAVEAGLGVEAALSRAARTGKGPLAQELARTLQEMQVGVARAQAFRNLAGRTNVSDLRHFVLAVVQAESYGIAVADVLRVQAAEQRMKRKQRAEEKAMKVPVKVIFPLICCILPTLFIVLIGPGAIRIARTFMGM